MLLMYLIDVEMRRGERFQPKLVIIDEAWDLMVRGHSSKFIEAGYRRARKLNGAFFTGTQGPGDYWKSSAAKAALDNADCKFIMKLKESVLSECEKESQLGLDDYELQQLRSLKGLRDVYSEVLVKIGDAPTSVNRLILDPFSLLVMSTHPKGHQRYQSLPQGRTVDEKSHRSSSFRTRSRRVHPLILLVLNAPLAPRVQSYFRLIL